MLVLADSLTVCLATVAAHKQKVRDRVGDAKFGTKVADIRIIIRVAKRPSSFGSILPGLVVRAKGRRYNVSIAISHGSEVTGETRIKRRGKCSLSASILERSAAEIVPVVGLDRRPG